MNKIRGFTLIEVVVVMGVVSIILVVSAVILTNSLRSTLRTESTSQLESSATWILGSIKQQVLRATPGSLVCPSGIGFSFANQEDKSGNNITSISCIGSPISDSQIASNSAHPSRMTPTSVRVSGCDNFVISCDATSLEIGFTLSMGSDINNIESNYKRSFVSRITLR